MNQDLIFALISTIIYLSGSFFYWRDTLRGRTIPHPFSNMIGLILVGFNFYILLIWGQYYSLIPLIPLVCSICIFGIGYGLRGIAKIRINWFDYLCFSLAIIMLRYWYFSNNILNTVIFTCIIDVITFLPVIKKSWLLPWTETSVAWFTGILNIWFLYLAQTDPTLETSLYWLTYVGVNALIVTVIISRRWYLRGWKSVFE